LTGPGEYRGFYRDGIRHRTKHSNLQDKEDRKDYTRQRGEIGFTESSEPYRIKEGKGD
jgi:hypothetical protein